VKNASLMTSLPFTMRFWGVRGTVPCPEADRLRYGGNTSCIEVRCGEARLVFDAGTGLRALGNELLATDDKRQSHIFFTHTHLDHIAGLPFFRPGYDAANHFEFWAGHLLQHGLSLKAVLEQLMQPPLFPVPLDILHACVSFHDFRPGEVLHPFPDVVVRTLALNHPGGATAYRIEFAGQAMCIVTDVEHRAGVVDQDIVGFIRGAAIVVYDCTYTEDEYARFVGWGHSTWQQGVKLCEAAGAERLVAFHHDPDHDDDFMDEMGRQLARARPGSLVAAEGLTLRP
jgi:phosphoribosyl 1,2-cyclic phosphodiesterase